MALGHCDSNYKFLWATFDVYGGGWADSDYGGSPGELLPTYAGAGRSRAEFSSTTLLQRRMGQSGMRGAGCPLEREDAWAALSRRVEALAAVVVSG